MKNIIKILKKSQVNNCTEAFFLMKCQTGGLQPYLKRDFGANVFPVNVEEFSK